MAIAPMVARRRGVVFMMTSLVVGVFWLFDSRRRSAWAASEEAPEIGPETPEIAGAVDARLDGCRRGARPAGRVSWGAPRSGRRCAPWWSVLVGGRAVRC